MEPKHKPDKGIHGSVMKYSRRYDQLSTTETHPMPFLRQKCPASPPSLIAQCLLEFVKICPSISKPVDNMKKVIESLSITK